MYILSLCTKFHLNFPSRCKFSLSKSFFINLFFVETNNQQHSYVHKCMYVMYEQNISCLPLTNAKTNAVEHVISPWSFFGAADDGVIVIGAVSLSCNAGQLGSVVVLWCYLKIFHKDWNKKNTIENNQCICAFVNIIWILYFFLSSLSSLHLRSFLLHHIKYIFSSYTFLILFLWRKNYKYSYFLTCKLCTSAI